MPIVKKKKAKQNKQTKNHTALSVRWQKNYRKENQKFEPKKKEKTKI